MKVLDFDTIRRIDCLSNSLAFIAMGDTDEAVISAIYHLTHDTMDDETRMMVSLYIAKIYTKMGEMDASIALLMRLLPMKRNEGAIYVLLASNFSLLHDELLSQYYMALAHDWNAQHDNVLTIDREYLYNGESDSSHKTLDRASEYIVNDAWHLAMQGDTTSARRKISSLPHNGVNDMYRVELLTALDIAENNYSYDTEREIDILLHGEISTEHIMSLIYILEKAGNNDAILSILRRAYRHNLCTCRLRYMYAIALHNAKMYDESMREMTRLESEFGIVYPYIVTAKYVIERSRNVHLAIYADDENLRLIRDSEVCRILLGGDMSALRDITVRSMTMHMYEDGVVTDAIGYVTHALLASEEGRAFLHDVLMDINVKSGKMLMYIARNLLEYTSDLMVVYENVVNACHMETPQDISNAELARLRDKVALGLISGETTSN